MQQTPKPAPVDAARPSGPAGSPAPQNVENRPVEIGGPQGLEPTRYGDWERNGRCVDF